MRPLEIVGALVVFRLPVLAAKHEGTLALKPQQSNFFVARKACLFILLLIPIRPDHQLT